ncbi:17842_t:CDS:2 [Gigaspora margarita]|uniref:17842_t:CDS:1 n=1 Tax=Gigaspora margarita TaxID=4874 RepID=A0ABN7UVE9_GIGMA|nr:17842_t:CDS:2 [Gigaspora margarita]
MNKENLNALEDANENHDLFIPKVLTSLDKTTCEKVQEGPDNIEPRSSHDQDGPWGHSSEDAGMEVPTS